VATAVGTAEKVGRRFSVVSYLPTAALVAFVCLVAASGAPWAPSLIRLRANLASLSVEEVATGSFVALVIALIVHPLQFGLVQLLEGYWRRRGLRGIVAEFLTERHRAHILALDTERLESTPTNSDAVSVDTARDDETGSPASRATDREARETRPKQAVAGEAKAGEGEAASTEAAQTPEHVRRSRFDRLLTNRDQLQDVDNARREDAQALFERSPKIDRVMPTRLGNALRYAEDFAGRRYGLKAVSVIPRLYPLMPTLMVDLLEDSRRELDLMARFTANFLIATMVMLLAFYRTPTWQCFALLAYCLGWLSYRGCVAAAREYGEMLIVAIDLYRFDLLQQMRIELPATIHEERILNSRLMALIEERDAEVEVESLRLIHPS
jgi:hypothetical protein